MTARAHKAGPIERAAMAVPVEDEKQRVLLAIAAFADEGRDDPSINEIHKRARVHWMAVVVKTEKLAREGWLTITKPAAPSGERARYALHLPESTTTKESHMAPATKSTQPVLPMTPPGWSSGWLKPLQSIEWSDYERIRERHEEAVAALVAAAGDRAAEIEALRAVAEVVEYAARVIPPEVDEAGEAGRLLEAKRTELQPPPASDKHPLEQGMSMAQARANADLMGSIRALDAADIRELLTAYRADFYWLSELSWHGSGSKLSTAAAYVGEVRRRCSEAAIEVA